MNKKQVKHILTYFKHNTPVQEKAHVSIKINPMDKYKTFELYNKGRFREAVSAQEYLDAHESGQINPDWKLDDPIKQAKLIKALKALKNGNVKDNTFTETGLPKNQRQKRQAFQNMFNEATQP